MSTLRICMLTTFYPPHNFGGDGIGVQRLAHAFARRGHEVTVIHDVDAYNALHAGGEPAEVPEPANVHTVRLRSGVGILSPLLTHQTGRPVLNRGRIRNVLGQGDFDITVFNNMSLVGGPAALEEGRGVTVYEAHEHWLVCPMHVLWRHNREPCTGRECIRCTLRYRRPPQLWRYTGLLDRSLDHVDAFIAKSEFSRRKHAEFGFDRPMEVIPYFLPDVAGAASPTAGAGAARERPYFLFVGRLERIKGLDDVIPAFSQYPDADLLIAGDGEYGGALRRLAGDARNIHFLGRVPLDDLRALYRNAIALIVPSTGFETFGIILIEAFREGVPVIARRIGPFPEIVETATGGLLFDGASDLLEAMSRLHSDNGSRMELGRNARAAYEKNWTEEAVVPRYFRLFRDQADRTGRDRIAEKLRMEEVA
jgi:glycosyltransferase involved in cell wall biosynthesis